MAASADLVRQNFVWRIESITATSTLERTSFVEVDPLRRDPENVTQRHFSVFWLGSEGENELDGMYAYDGNHRAANHHFGVEVYYRADKMRYDELQHLILQDRNDIIYALQNDNLDGYNASNSSTELKMGQRHREEDEIDRGEDAVWIYRSTWKCTIEETGV